MSLEIEILTALINAYERSKVSKGQNKVHKDIKLDITHRVFDKHRNNDNCELEIAIQRIERDGLAKTSYTRNGQLQCLILNVDEEKIDELYKMLKRQNPKSIIEQYKVFFENRNDSCQIICDFAQKMIELLCEKKLSTVQQYVSSLDDAEDICRAIDAMSTLEEDVRERIFCAKILSDSKRFLSLRPKIAKIIKEFSEEPFDDEEDVIAAMGVIKNTAYAFIKGDLKIKLNNQIINLKDYKEPLALSDSAIINIEILEVNASELITIENLTSFDVFNRNNAIIIYLGGFHNRVKRDLIFKIFKKAREVNCYHYGDIDAGGFYILNHLRNKTGIKFQPLMMGVDVLVQFKSNCRPLSLNDKNRLYKMADDIRFVEFNDVIKYMLEHNVKLEQEVEA